MRKGWKTRIDERKYFENKQEEREAKAAFMQMARAKLTQEIMQMNAEMKRELGEKYETH